MREIHSLYLLAILGLLSIIALGVSQNSGNGFQNFGFISTFILFFIGFFGIAFRDVKKKNKI